MSDITEEKVDAVLDEYDEMVNEDRPVNEIKKLCARAADLLERVARERLEFKAEVERLTLELGKR